MVWAAWRLILLSCAWLVPCAPGLAQEKPAAIDASLLELIQTKTIYEQDLKALGEDLLGKLDAEREKELAKPEAERNLDATKRRIQYLKQDREALLERGEWPTAIPIAEIRYHWVNERRGRVRDAYKKAAAAAEQRGDENTRKQLAGELALFDKTNDLAPWQDLATWVELGQGAAAWSRAGQTYTCPAKGPTGGARNPLRFRRPMPTEYAVRYTLKWIEGEGDVMLGLVDARGQLFDLPVKRPARSPASSSAASGSSAAGASASSASDVVRVLVHVLKDRMSVSIDGREVRSWTEGQEFPVEREPLGPTGPEIFIASNDSDTRFKVTSAEIKCYSWSAAAPVLPGAKPDASAATTTPTTPTPTTGATQGTQTTPTKPPQVAARYEKTAVVSSALRGLDWLIRHQGKDGGWKLESYTDACPTEMPCIEPGHKYSQEYDPGVTGLATLALVRAHEQLSKSVSKEPVDLASIDAAARAGVAWLTSRITPAGSFCKGKSFVYNEALCTLALVSAYGFTKNRELQDPAQRAADYLMRAQRPSPNKSDGLWGWRYAPRMEVEDPRKATGNENYAKDLHDSDTSATGWAVMALSTAQRAGLEVKKANLEGAFDFAKYVTADNGLVGYLDPLSAGQLLTGKNDLYVYHPAAMSALGLCIRLYAHHESGDAFIDLAARRLVSNLPLVSKDKLSVDYYYWYCGTVALDQLDGPDSANKGGKYWNPWNKALVDALLALQDAKEDACSRGAWLVPDRWSFTGGPVYATAINALTLEDSLGWK